MSQQLEEAHFKAVDNKWYISILPYEESEYEDWSLRKKKISAVSLMA